jgi:acetoin utilization deacetylase AcuC-like enzyme
VSGFHHAGHRRAMGYCTFNGLIVTAYALRDMGLAKSVGILDFDMHYGNGTEELINRSKATDWIHHITAGETYYSRSQACQFLDDIPQMMKSLRHCDVILYQAGADPHVNDPKGGFLTTEQLKERDRLVFSLAQHYRTPIAWNLAGGYQTTTTNTIEPILEIHRNTLLACAETFL